MRCAATVIAGLLTCLAAHPADALTDSQKQRLVACMIDRTGPADREKIAQVYVQAFVRVEVRREDWNDYVEALGKLFERCGLEISDMTADGGDALEGVVGAYIQGLLDAGLENMD